MTFTTDYIPFRKRFLDRYLIVIVIVILAIVYFSNKYSFQNFTFFLILFIAVSFYTIVSLAKTKTIINEVTITNNLIIIVGYNFDTKWQKEFEIKNSKIKLVYDGNRSTAHYIIKILIEKEKFDINTLHNWNYFKIIDLFKVFKEAKQEKIIVDENIQLINVERLANGFSLLDMGLSKKKSK